MFSYSCEKCGREVPPAYSECPDCAQKAGAATAVLDAPPAPPLPATATPVPPAPAAAPVASPSPTAPRSAPPIARVQPVRSGTPGWLVALLVGGVLIGGGYLFIEKGLPMLRGEGPTAFEEPASSTPLTSGSTSAAAASASASVPGGAPDPARYLQVTGLRINEVNRKPQISMVVVNHAAAELVDIKSTVLIRTVKDRPDADPIAKLELKLGSIGPNEVRDVTLSLPTRLRAYELPDWQFLAAEIVPAK